MTDAPSTAPTLAASSCLSRCRLDSHIREAVAVSRLCSCSCQSALVLSINILRSAKLLPTHSIPKVVSMAQPNESTMKRAIRLVGECYSIHRLDPSVGSSVSLSLPEFIGELKHKFPQSFIVKYSDKADSSSPLQDT